MLLLKVAAEEKQQNQSEGLNDKNGLQHSLYFWRPASVASESNFKLSQTRWRCRQEMCTKVSKWVSFHCIFFVFSIIMMDCRQQPQIYKDTVSANQESKLYTNTPAKSKCLNVHPLLWKQQIFNFLDIKG